MTSPFGSDTELLEAFPDDQACIEHLEQLRWQNRPVSPFDPASSVYKCEGNSYKCRNTNKYFNVRTGTIFEDTKIPMRKWFLALFHYLESNKSITAIALSDKIGVGRNAAQLMTKRFRSAFN